MMSSPDLKMASSLECNVVVSDAPANITSGNIMDRTAENTEEHDNRSGNFISFDRDGKARTNTIPEPSTHASHLSSQNKVKAKISDSVVNTLHMVGRLYGKCTDISEMCTKSGSADIQVPHEEITSHEQANKTITKHQYNANVMDAIRKQESRETDMRLKEASQITMQMNDKILNDAIGICSTDSVTDTLNVKSESQLEVCVINVDSCSSIDNVFSDWEDGDSIDENLLRVCNTAIDTPKSCGSLSLSSVHGQPYSGSPVKKETVSRRDSGIFNGTVSGDGNLSGDENLDEARSRMHRLLDEAFLLISPRSSFSENDLRNSVQNAPMTSLSHTNESAASPSKSSNRPLDPKRGMDIKHEPFYINPAFAGSYSDSPLQTWSPYRASDQVALISMPRTIEVTKLGQKSKDGKQPTATSKSPRRPAASFEFPETRSTSQLDESKYTTNPPKPIVLRTKDLSSAVSNSSSNNNPARMSGNLAMTGINGDVFLTNSTTSLSKPQSKTNQKSNTIEMQQMKSYKNEPERKHRAPTRDLKNSDEVDIINDITHDGASDTFFRSLKEELEAMKEEYNVDTVGGKKTRRKNAKSMTEIV